MPLTCPACASGTLSIECSLELPPDARSDEISVQIVGCGACGFRGVGIYQESRRGALDDESVDHVCYAATPEALTKVRGLMRRCPKPRSATCACASHKALAVVTRFAERQEAFPGVEWDRPRGISFTR